MRGLSGRKRVNGERSSGRNPAIISWTKVLFVTAYLAVLVEESLESYQNVML